MRWVLVALRIALGLFFIYAGADKLSDPLAFAENIAEYDVFSIEVSTIAARFLPVLEVLAGLTLVTGYGVLGGAAIIGTLNAIFAVLIGVASARGLSIDCGCFTGSGKTGPLHVFFNLALCALSIAIYWRAIVGVEKVTPASNSNAPIS